MLNNSDELLILLLAKTHAVWTPLRDWSGNLPRNLYFARRRFRLFGVKWASGGASNADQQAAHRALEQAAAAGLVATTKPHATKTLFAKLTDAGESRALALVGMPSIADSLAAMRDRLAPLHQHPDTTISDWVPEWLICGWRPDKLPPIDELRAALYDLQELLFPTLVRELVEGLSDMEGRGFYRLTERGWGILDNPPTLPAWKRPKQSEAAIDLYYETLGVAIAEIRAADEKKNELGYIPLSCSPETYRIVETYGDRRGPAPKTEAQKNPTAATTAQ